MQQKSELERCCEPMYCFDKGLNSLHGNQTEEFLMAGGLQRDSGNIYYI